MKKFIYIDIIYNKKEYKQQQEKNCNTISQYVNVKKIKNENGLIKQYKKAIIKIDKKFRKIKKQNINDKTLIIPSLKVIEILRKLNEKTDEKTQRKYANITENIKKQEESKQIYKENITKILDNIIKIRKEEMQTQSIYILVKGIEGIKYNELQKMLENYKIIYIVAKNLKNFEELEKKAEENLDMLAIVNNKRKSLARAKYIINVDFNEEEINTYCINRNAVIFNQSKNKIKNIIGFQGIIINNIKIKEENCKYPIELEYEKYKAEIIKKIYNGEYILIGNNGKIDKKEI